LSFSSTDFELSDSLRPKFPKQKPRSVIEPARSDFVSRVPTALDYLCVQEREVRCFSPKV